MKRRMNQVLIALLVLITGTRAVSFGAALSVAPQTRPRESRSTATPAIPRPVTFREVPGRGLIVRAWVNSAGPFNFAIDTGSGATLLSPRVAGEAQIDAKAGRGTSVSGLTGVNASAREASLKTIAVGDGDNYLPGMGVAIITNGLPRDLDGVLDPIEAFAPLGFVIDIPAHELSAFDPRELPLRLSVQPAGGAVVSWLREAHSRRPFVKLDNGDRALIDTGSTLGLAIKDRDSTDEGMRERTVRDIGGGRVSSRRVRPTTVAIGALTLRNIPTDLISGAEADAPVLLGLSALRPFRMRFDPVHYLIEIEPGINPRR